MVALSLNWLIPLSSLWLISLGSNSGSQTPDGWLNRSLNTHDGFWNWVESLNPVSGSKLDKAVIYAKNQKQNIMNVFLDGRLELTNSAAERKVKSYVIGRKNFLFHDIVDGAEASAIVYSLVETAKANNLNIFQYLKTLLLFMPDYKNEPEGIEEMMPWSDFIQAACPGPHKEDSEIRLKS